MQPFYAQFNLAHRVRSRFEYHHRRPNQLANDRSVGNRKNRWRIDNYMIEFWFQLVQTFGELFVLQQLGGVGQYPAGRHYR